MNARLPVVLALAGLTGLAPHLAAQQVRYEGGLVASTGRYFFTERTSSFGLSTGLAIRQGRWSVRASVPVWLQNTTLISSSGIGPVPTGGPEGQGTVSDSGQAREQRRQGKAVDNASGGDGTGTGGSGGNGGGGQQGNGNGSLLLHLGEEAIPAPADAVTGYEARLGDPFVGANLRLIDAGRLAITIGGTVKVPLAGTETIGTGEWDVGASLSASALLGTRFSIGADIGYWRLGDLDSLELRDPVLGSVSIGALLNDRWSALVAVTAGSRPLTGFDPPVLVTLALSRLTGGGTWAVSVGAGLTESSPDLMAGLTWSIPLAGGGAP